MSQAKLSVRGGTPGIHVCGTFDFYLPSPPSEIWLRTRVPGWGCLLFMCEGMGPSQIVSCACLCAGHLGIEVVRLKPWKTAVFNRGKQLFLYLYKNSAFHYSFSRWVYLIWFDQILRPHSGNFDQKFFWKVKCPTYVRGSSLRLNIDRCRNLSIELYNRTYQYNQSCGSCKSS